MGIGLCKMPSPAMVVALLALVVATGGSATAAALITSADIKDGTVRSVDVANNNLRGGDVRANTLRGSDIAEWSLGEVPAARTVGGLTVRPVRVAQAAGAGEQVVLATGGLLVRMRCDGTSRLSLVSRPGTQVQVLGVTTPVSVSGSGPASSNAAGSYDGTGGVSVIENSGIGRAIALGRDGLVSVLDYAYVERTNAFGTADDCFLRGVLMTTASTTRVRTQRD